VRSALGLSSAEAAERRATVGPNVLVPETSATGLRSTLRHIVTDPMAILLAIASGTYFALGETEDAVIAVVALIPVVGVSLVLELRAERALESLRQLTAPVARAIRDGVETLVPAMDVVPGDALVLREGDIVPADGHIVSGADVVVDESALTGESLPVMKSVASDDEAMIWAGTTVLSGRGTAIVSVTGARTRYGAIGMLMSQSEVARTPL